MKTYLTALLPCLITAPLFADAAPAAPARNWNVILLLGLGLILFYLVLFRPEQKKHKKIQEMRKSLVKGSRVTAMGILGTVVRIEEKTVVLKMVDGSQIEMLKEAITRVEPASSEQSAKATPPA